MKKVVDFYKTIPFNYSKDLSFYKKNITEINQVLEYKDLHNICLKRKRIFGNYLVKDVIEFGCGTGWLTNSLAYNYKKNLVSVDFTEKALETAKQISQSINVHPQYFKSDIFDFQDKRKFDLVVSLGVLHHTKNCKEAFKKISKFVNDRGYLYVGLYHLYGRKPMLDFFKSYCNWHGEESAYGLFNYMTKEINNNEHSYSWFRDQVLHPHETQHTLSEVITWLKEIGFTLKSTSVNNYKPLKSTSYQDLETIEKSFQKISYDKNVKDLVFTPGYFTVCAQKI